MNVLVFFKIKYIFKDIHIHFTKIQREIVTPLYITMVRWKHLLRQTKSHNTPQPKPSIHLVLHSSRTEIQRPQGVWLGKIVLWIFLAQCILRATLNNISLSARTDCRCGGCLVDRCLRARDFAIPKRIMFLKDQQHQNSKNSPIN